MIQINFNKIKQYIKKYPQLESLYMGIKSLNDPSLSEKIIGIKKNPYNLIMKKNGESRPKENIYFISLDKEYCINGFCSLLRFTLYYLAFAEDINMTPVVKWGKNTLYYDNTIKWTDNVFEYFFNAVSEVTVKETQNCKHVITSKTIDTSVFGPTSGYKIQNESFIFLGQILKKYINLREDVFNLINKDFYTNKKTLGVHVRATDFNKGYNHHPKVITPREYLETAKKVFIENKFEKIFLATDDNSVINLFQMEFGDNLCYYTDTYRSINGEAIHYGNQRIKREHHKYQLGIEILKDLYTLGNCSGLIAGNSNVSMCARIVKASTGETFEYMKIIDKGLNQSTLETNKDINPNK